MRDRKVARCIVAPNGYGKTFAALEYAETMFSWVHVFWVNAQSPCFLRDLDDRCIAKACGEADPEAALVVFEDVPALESERAELFSREIDDLLASNVEVIVTCTPVNDFLGSYQRDRVRVSGADLLLSDDEIAMKLSPEERMRMPAEDRPSWQRVAALVWNRDEDTAEQFVKGILQEEMPIELLSALANSFVLQQGPISGAQALSKASSDDILELLVDYPHIELSYETGRFHAPAIPISDIVTPLKKVLQRIAAYAQAASSNELVSLWADRLMQDGQEERACDLVRHMLSRPRRGAWLVENAHQLVQAACFLPALRLAAEQDKQRGDLKIQLCAIEAICRNVLGDTEEALQRAKTCGFNELAPESVRICGLIIVSRLGDQSLSARAYQLLSEQWGREGAPIDIESRWALLARAWCACWRGLGSIEALWSNYLDGGVDEETLLMCASWLFDLVEGNADDPIVPSGEIGRCIGFVRERLSMSGGLSRNYYLASAGLALERAHVRGLVLEGGPLPSPALFELRKFEMQVIAQRNRFEEEMRSFNNLRLDWANAHPDTLLNQNPLKLDSASRRKVPVLSIRLFGCFDVAIGGVPVDKRKFSRRNTRMLLALLAAGQGREVSRESLVRAMWPNAPADNGRKSFYTAWSSLKVALTLPDGTCPYLTRHQSGCRLEGRYVHSDIDDFEDICRELLFGVPNEEQWSLMFAQIERDYASEFMPSEHRNALINQTRMEYRNRLVDALVAAASSIADTNSPQWGVWFARTALRHDDTREDAYIALMRAQIASDQRTAAMMTFLKCRKVLSEKLGIDPSPEMMRLYESLLDNDGRCRGAAS